MKRQRLSRCHICSSPAHVEIDLALSRRVAVRAISRRYKISIDAIYRHAKNHLTAPMRAKLIAGPDLAEVDLEKLRIDESASLLANVVALRARLFAALDEAESFGDVGQIAKVSGQLHSNFELVGKLLGDLAAGSVVNINNVLVLPQYLEMRAALVNALLPHPAARKAVAAVLHRIEEKAAADMQVIEGSAK